MLINYQRLKLGIENKMKVVEIDGRKAKVLYSGKTSAYVEYLDDGTTDVLVRRGNEIFRITHEVFGLNPMVREMQGIKE